jgi:hypothetical protein
VADWSQFEDHYMRTVLKLTLNALVAAILLANPIRAEIIGGVDFPAGAISFAYSVTTYSP